MVQGVGSSTQLSTIFLNYINNTVKEKNSKIQRKQNFTIQCKIMGVGGAQLNFKLFFFKTTLVIQ